MLLMETIKKKIYNLLDWLEIFQTASRLIGVLARAHVEISFISLFFCFLSSHAFCLVAKLNCASIVGLNS